MAGIPRRTKQPNTWWLPIMFPPWEKMPTVILLTVMSPIKRDSRGEITPQHIDYRWTTGQQTSLHSLDKTRQTAVVNSCRIQVQYNSMPFLCQYSSSSYKISGNKSLLCHDLILDLFMISCSFLLILMYISTGPGVFSLNMWSDWFYSH